MADTGWQFCGTGAGTSSGVFAGDWAWVNPGNITADDNVYANRSGIYPAENTQGLSGYNFGFSIPSGDTIDGIEIRYRRLVDQGVSHNERALRLRLADGSIGATDRAVTNEDWATTEEVAVRGGSTDLWGETPTPADINDIDWGYTLATANNDTAWAGANPHNAQVDSFEMRVYHTSSGGGFFVGGLMQMGIGR